MTKISCDYCGRTLEPMKDGVVWRVAPISALVEGPRRGGELCLKCAEKFTAYLDLAFTKNLLDHR